ncbi:MAG: InlB B-repeat-containing protein, partial [Synergistaceae bacterium]|nr:InlB B-repeat-containing protein [Synergistaceae bacterium]
IIVNGTVNLILNDGATLKANGGIHVYKGNTLNIYAQMNGTGKIVAAGGSGNAGIGGGSVRNRTSNPQYDRSCGTINIYGGTVEATGGTDAAGIGCGAIYQDTTDGGTINIHGGTVTATGGKSGAGIGGGKVYDAGKFTNLQNVNISGGTVTATGGKSAAGIGGGYKCPGGTVTITGGNVTATTKYSSNNGIGNGDLAYSATIKLGWTKRTDSIYSGQYNGDVTLTKDFMLKGTSTQATTGNIGGQTIVPPVSVTFDANGGSGTMDAVKSAYGHSYTLPECTFTPKKGQGFDYWLIGDVEYSEGGSLDVTSDIVVKTVWKETDRTVTFDANGHGTAPDAQTVDYAKTMDEPTAPTADGYTFGGWYKEADCVNRWNFAADTVTEDMTLYAKWAVNAYTISYELDGGIDATNNPLIYTTEDSTITLEAPTKTGYTFKGWTPDGTIPSGSTGNKTFTATWEINKYTITFETWGGTQVDSITQDYSTDVTAPSTTPTKRGAVFSEWENMPSKMPAENITVNAVWRTLYHYEAREATCFEEGISECWYLYGNYYTETLSDGVYTYTLMTDSPVTPKVTHSYGEPDSDSWTWFTDSYSGEIAARLTLTCPTCHTSVSINTSEGEVTSEVTTEPTDDDEGVMTYTATVTVDADSYNTAETKTYTGTHTEPIPKTTKIARIGDTWYPSLGAALDAADDDDVIVLSVDVYEPNTECDTGYKNITLDLNGHEVTLKSLNAEYSLTVKNGTLTCYVNNSNSGNDHTLTLDNAELVCRENEMNYGIQWMANNIVLSNDSKMYVIGNVFLGGSDFTMSIDRTSTMELYDATISTYSPARVGEQLSPYLPEGYTLDTTSEQETVHVLYNGEEYHGEATFGLFSLFVWFDSNGGSYVAPQTFKLNRGDEAQATEPVAPTREGYEFVEWQLNGTAYDFSEAVTGDLVLTAKWKFAPSDSNKPQFAYHSLILSGQIGVIFHVYVPEGAVSKDYCTYFDVSGDKSQNTQPVYPFEEFTEDGNKFFGFKCYINSVQMADEIHAVLNYGNDKTLDYTYTAKRYLDSLIADTTQSEDVTELGRAIKDYGSYVQPILAEENHWEVGKKHAKMDAAYDFDDTDFETVSNDTKDYAIVCNVPEGSGIEDVSFALVLDSETAIEIYLASKDGYTGTVCAYIGTNTTDNMAVKKGSEYVISIGNVSAHLLGREYTVNVATGDVNFDVKISALSYVQSAIHDKSEAMKRAVTSLYRYWKATMTYRSKRSEYQ